MTEPELEPFQGFVKREEHWARNRNGIGNFNEDNLETNSITFYPNSYLLILKASIMLYNNIG